jgi:glutathione S-transferase
LKLYYSPGACSLAPHIVARELRLDVEFIAVPIAESANSKPEYLAINPRARVPALQVGELVYTEAPALLPFLASQIPGSGLLPPVGSTDYARCLEWLCWFSSNLHIAYARVWRPERFLPAGYDSAAFTAHAKQQIEGMNDEVEARLDGGWLVASGCSVADIYALIFYRWGNRIGFPMKERWPRWRALVQRLLERPAVQAAITHEGIGFDHFDPSDLLTERYALVI